MHSRHFDLRGRVKIVGKPLLDLREQTAAPATTHWAWRWWTYGRRGRSHTRWSPRWGRNWWPRHRRSAYPDTNSPRWGNGLIRWGILLRLGSIIVCRLVIRRGWPRGWCPVRRWLLIALIAVCRRWCGRRWLVGRLHPGLALPPFLLVPLALRGSLGLDLGFLAALPLLLALCTLIFLGVPHRRIR